MGVYDAGAVKQTVYEKYYARGLRLIKTTQGISSHLLVASPRLSNERFLEIQQHLLNIKNTRTAHKILHAIKPGVTNFINVKDSDYDKLLEIIQLSDRLK